MPACLITGATGAIGPSVVEAFRHAGYQVRTLTRHVPPAGLLPSDVTVFAGDVTDQARVAAAMDGVDVVAHLASLLHVVNPAATLKREYERVNVEGTATVVNAAVAAGAQRVVLVSTIAVYGSSPAPVDEGSAVRPDTLYGETKLRAEHVALNAQRPDGSSLCTVMRAAAVYGPRIKGNYRRLVHALARRRFVQMGDGRSHRALVFDRDLASAIVLGATRQEAAGRVYNVSDGHAHTVNDIVSAICGALGRHPPRVKVPAVVARAAAATADVALRLSGRPMGLRQLVDKYLEDVVIDSRRIRADLGFTPCVTFDAGWDETVAALGVGSAPKRK